MSPAHQFKIQQFPKKGANWCVQPSFLLCLAARLGIYAAKGSENGEKHNYQVTFKTDMTWS